MPIFEHHKMYSKLVIAHTRLKEMFEELISLATKDYWEHIFELSFGAQDCLMIITRVEKIPLKDRINSFPVILLRRGFKMGKSAAE